MAVAHSRMGVDSITKQLLDIFVSIQIYIMLLLLLRSSSILSHSLSTQMYYEMTFDLRAPSVSSTDPYHRAVS